MRGGSGGFPDLAGGEILFFGELFAVVVFEVCPGAGR